MDANEIDRAIAATREEALQRKAEYDHYPSHIQIMPCLSRGIMSTEMEDWRFALSQEDQILCDWDWQQRVEHAWFFAYGLTPRFNVPYVSIDLKALAAASATPLQQAPLPTLPPQPLLP